MIAIYEILCCFCFISKYSKTIFQISVFDSVLFQDIAKKYSNTAEQKNKEI